MNCRSCGHQSHKGSSCTDFLLQELIWHVSHLTDIVASIGNGSLVIEKDHDVSVQRVGSGTLPLNEMADRLGESAPFRLVS